MGCRLVVGKSSQPYGIGLNLIKVFHWALALRYPRRDVPVQISRHLVVDFRKWLLTISRSRVSFDTIGIRWTAPLYTIRMCNPFFETIEFVWTRNVSTITWLFGSQIVRLSLKLEGLCDTNTQFTWTTKILYFRLLMLDY